MNDAPSWTALEPRVYASDQPLPERDFTGYGYVGLDFIAGQAGRKAFEASRQRVFDTSNDGCYLDLRRDGAKHIIATDPMGMCKLFVYQGTSGWAVSNSFATLMDYVNTRRWHITPNYAVLDAWTIPLPTFTSCISPTTVAREVTFLQTSQLVEIEGGSLHIRKRDATTHAPVTYEEAINTCLDLWLGRIATLANAPDLKLNAELTGGLDSRTVLAFLLHLRDRGAIKDFDQTDIFCARPSSKDHAVAASLAQTFDFNLGRRPSPSGTPQTPEGRVAAWRAFALGMFGEPFLPLAQSETRTFTLGGHGGERLRAPSKLPSFSDRMSPHAHLFRRFSRFKATLEANEDLLAQAGTRLPAYTVFREFRGRLHDTHMAQLALRHPPLMGTAFTACFDALDELRQEDGFLMYDILQRLQPGLAAHPFDDPEKQLSDADTDGFGPLFTRPILTGAVFLDTDTPQISAQTQKGSETTALFTQMYQTARENALNEALTPLTLALADQAATQIALDNKLPDKMGFQPVHAVLLSGVLAQGRLSTPTRLRECAFLTVKRLRDSVRGN